MIGEEVEFAGTAIRTDTVENEDNVSILPRVKRIKAFFELQKPEMKKEIQVMCGILTLVHAEGGGAIIIHHRRIAFLSATEHQMNPGPVCEFEFCRCGPVEKKQSALFVSV